MAAVDLFESGVSEVGWEFPDSSLKQGDKACLSIPPRDLVGYGRGWRLRRCRSPTPFDNPAEEGGDGEDGCQDDGSEPGEHVGGGTYHGALG